MTDFRKQGKWINYNVLSSSISIGSLEKWYNVVAFFYHYSDEAFAVLSLGVSLWTYVDEAVAVGGVRY